MVDSLLLVNTSPGEETLTRNPNDPIFFGIKSTARSVVLGGLNVRLGFTNIDFNTVLPESDTSLLSEGVNVRFDSAELYRPVVGSATKVISSNNLVITTTTNTQAEQSIYSIHYNCDVTQSTTAYIKFQRNTSWITSSPNWGGSGITSIVPVYFSLEYGPQNTSCTVFLKDNGATGSFIVAGPSLTYGSSGSRSGLTTFSGLDWKTLSNGQSIELWIVFNAATNNVDLWGRLATSASPTLLGSVAVTSLGIYPKESVGTFNSRIGPTNTCSIYFGVGGTSNIGQSLTVVDWALFQDFRQSVLNGEPVTNTIFNVLPDTPVEYSATSGNTPATNNPGKWLSTATPPNATMFYQPGIRTTPLYSTFSRTSGTAEIAFIKEEPRISTLTHGIAIEGYISGSSISRVGNTTGMGFGVEDGVKAYYLMMLNDAASNPTFGILSNSIDPTLLSNYFNATSSYDYTDLHLVKLVIDRYRSKVLMFIDNMDHPIQTIPIGSTFPSSPTGTAFIKFGHFNNIGASGSLNISSLNYLPKYKAWEGVDANQPDSGSVASVVRFTKNSIGTGNTAVSYDIGFTITKPSINTVSSKLSYSRPETMGVQSGIQMDFRTGIYTYRDVNGTTFASNTHVGTGVNIFLGGKKLRIGFYDCGIYGRKIGVTPGSGSETDIIRQTILGTAFSAPVDWTKLNTYRLVIKPHDAIKVWTGRIIDAPAIVIPWKDDTFGFDLPSDVTSSSIEFGHIDYDSSSVSKWEFVRWGTSNGYEVSVENQYPNGIDQSCFSGRVEEFITITDD